MEVAMGRQMERHGVGRRGVAVGALAVAAALVVPLAAPASTHRASRAPAQPVGVVLGGANSQGWPIVIELSKNGRQAVRVSTGIRLFCGQDMTMSSPDTYLRVPISKRGKFAASFGPQTESNADGTTDEFQGSMSGTINRSRTKASGSWQVKGTTRDAAGTVIDTCDSRALTWTAKQ
jgi:hypothetical protein